MNYCIRLPVQCVDGTLLHWPILSTREGKKKKDESSSQFSMVQHMVIPFAILQSRESEGSDLFIRLASSAREH